MSSTESLTTSAENPATGPRIAVDLTGGLALLAIAAVFLLNAGEGRLDWLFPVALSYTQVVFAVYLIIRGLLGYGDRVGVVPPILRGKGVDVAVFIGMAAAYVVLSEPVGFWIMSVAMIIVSSIYLATVRSRKNVMLSVAVALGVILVAYGLLLHVFYVPLPEARWLPF
ncbi:MAG: hypothetical protein GEU81_14000 [Nitriliruptorales bacterium]|nr:hypothetical protein [Nitriliruptorales bacterium]